MNARKLFAVLTALCLMMGVCVLAEENISDEAYVFSVDDVESVVSDAISDDTLISVEEVDQSYSDTSLDLGEEDAENGLDQDVSVTVIVEEGEGEETNPVVDMAVSEDSNENDTAEDGEETPSTLTDEAGVADGMIESITIEGETQVEDQDASAQTILLFEGTVQGENHPVSLAGATVTCDPQTYTYDGNQKVPSLTVKLADGTTLASTDYEVSYDPAAHIDAGTVKVIVTGKGNYKDTASGSFKIDPASITGATVACDPQTVNYDGTPKTTTVTVTLNGNTLTNGTDYEISYDPAAHTEAGTVKVTVTGKGNYKDTATGSFIIRKQISIAGATVTCDPKSYTYDGNQKVPSLTVKLTDGTTLASTDYDVTYSPDNVNAGTVTVKVTAKGDYTGEATGTFVINKAEKTVTAKYTGDVPNKEYDKSRNLPSGFTFKSRNFEYVGKAAGDTITIDQDKKDSSGKKIFSAGYDGVDVGSHKLTFKLAINTYSSTNYIYKLASDTITSEKSGNITPKKLTIRPGVKKKDANGNVVKDSNGKIVVETQTKVYGTSDPSSFSGVVDGIMEGDSLAGSFSGKLSREPGENVGNYPITIGTLKTMGNYATDPQLEEGYFEILPKSISDFELDPIPDQQYTGSAVTPDKEIKLKYESKALGTKTLVKGTDFDVQYSNNVEPGMGTVTITGKGNYTGTRTESFTILHKPSLLDKGIRISPIGSQKYTGSALEPVITVTYTKEGGDTQTLVEGTDYDVLYDNNIEIGIATVTLVGKGHFTGQRSIFFTIEKDGGSDPSSGAEDNPSSGTGDNPSSGTGDNTSSGSGNNSTSDTNDSSNTGSTSSVQSETTIDLVPNDPAPVPAPAPAAVVAQEPVTIAKVPASTKAKAGKKGKVTVSWKKIKKSKKTKALLGQIKSVQVQYSTDPNFAADVVTKTVSKKKTKLNLKLQKKTTYYIRVRYVGADGVSDWGAVKKVTTKK